MSLRDSALQFFLDFAGGDGSGCQQELLAKAFPLAKSGSAPSSPMKIKELYRRRYPRKILNGSELTMLHMPGGALPSTTSLPQGAVCHLGYDNSAMATAVTSSMLPPLPMLGPKHEPDIQHLSPPI
ncbi:unnamed protein product, partial [Staurois parvus]